MPVRSVQMDRRRLRNRFLGLDAPEVLEPFQVLTTIGRLLPTQLRAICSRVVFQWTSDSANAEPFVCGVQWSRANDSDARRSELRTDGIPSGSESFESVDDGSRAGSGCERGPTRALYVQATGAFAGQER